jgi:hypothetical protein
LRGLILGEKEVYHEKMEMIVGKNCLFHRAGFFPALRARENNFFLKEEVL